jgi:peptidoglycan/xylan/chitin deacetylase (PgdA/CDA1 family)
MAAKVHMKGRITTLIAAQRWLGLSTFIIVLASGTPMAAKSTRLLPIIVYHEIRTSGDEPADGPTAISLQRFESQMAYLHGHGYRTLSMEEAIRFLQGERFPSKVVAIHFDDGWKSELSAVPVLDRFGFRASFWIIAGKGIGWPYMEWDDVERLAANPHFEIFSHTMTHPWKDNDTLVDWVNGRVPGKGLEQASWELGESRRVLEEKLGKPVPFMAWPRGLYNDTLIDLAQQARYRALLTIDDGLNRPGDDPLRIHRTMIDGACSDEIFKKILKDGKYRTCGSPPMTRRGRSPSSAPSVTRQH